MASTLTIVFIIALLTFILNYIWRPSQSFDIHSSLQQSTATSIVANLLDLFRDRPITDSAVVCELLFILPALTDSLSNLIQ